jgi:hypothetical protein
VVFKDAGRRWLQALTNVVLLHHKDVSSSDPW